MTVRVGINGFGRIGRSFTRVLLDRVEAYRKADTGPPASGRHAGGTPALHDVPPLDPDLVAALRQTLAGAARDPAFAAEAMALPSEVNLAEEMPVIAVEAIHAARESARAEIAEALGGPLGDAYEQFADSGPYRIDGLAIGRRALRNACLFYLSAGDRREGARLAKAQFDAGANMTDVLAALAVLTDIDCPERETALDAFVRASPHRQAMAALRPHMGTTRIVRWAIRGAAIPPTWAEARRREALA